jgi:hypothetical protein
MSIRKLLASIGITAWGIAVVIGYLYLMDYSAHPGRQFTPPWTMPVNGFKYRQEHLPTLLVFSHPQCPCTRATIAELARLIAHHQGRANVHVLFFRPLDKPREWAESDLWRQAIKLPVTSVSTVSEFDLQRFGITTSGQTLLYDAAGKLVFSGGITRFRGHEGDNLGRTAISEFLQGNPLPTAQTPVFGCSFTATE